MDCTAAEAPLEAKENLRDRPECIHTLPTERTIIRQVLSCFIKDTFHFSEIKMQRSIAKGIHRNINIMLDINLICLR